MSEMSNSEEHQRRQEQDADSGPGPSTEDHSEKIHGPQTEFIPSRPPFWPHPTTGYLNAETYFPPTHPFARRVVGQHDQSAFAYRHGHFLRTVRAPSYVNAFPRRGIGPRENPSMFHLTPYRTDPLYVYRPDQRANFQGTNPNLYPMQYDPRHVPFPSGEERPETRHETKPSGSSQGGGSSESESVEPPPAATTPIFHPLPSMFHRLPQPLSFPMSSQSQALPTLALYQNCSLESKVVSDYADSHQELSLMLALPGLSAHQAPLLSLQQAGNILQAVNNPLVVLKVGRLTRKLLPNPALLKPTGDVGTLALWLSPTSDVRLFWHSFLKGPTSDTARRVEEQISQIRSHGEGSPYKELFSHVELSEELAWVAAESDQVDGGCGIRLEMMKHDPSGRSFKLIRKKGHDRQKTELASKLETKEENSGEHETEEHHKLRQLLEQCMSEDPEEEDSYFFWIAESSVSEGLEMLNAMQNRLDHLPTLAGESGVPEKKLQELHDWFSKGQEAASGDSNLRNEIASWIDLRSGASVPSQLFSNSCPANVPNWAESQPSTSTDASLSDAENHSTIREGCALSATANFLVADKKWGLTHLATASVMVAVGVESTGLFYDEEKAHLDLSHCAHELAKKRAEAGASAEAERLGRIRLEELVAVKSLNAMESTNRTEPRPAVSPRRTEYHSLSPQSEELIQQQQRAMWQSFHGYGQRRPPLYASWGGRPGLQTPPSIQGNSVLHHAHSDVVTHMPDYFRQHVHYGVPIDHHPSGQLQWKYDHGEAGGNVQVMVPYQQYDHPSMSLPGAFHPYPWPYGASVYQQPSFGPPPPPAPVPSFFPRHLPPQLPFLQVQHLQPGRRHKQPNLSLVRLVQEAREKVARHPRDRIRAGPSGSNLAAANIDMHPLPEHDDIAFAAFNQDPASQLGTLYRNSSVNVGRTPDNDTMSETRTHAETPRNTTADEADKM